MEGIRERRGRRICREQRRRQSRKGGVGGRREEIIILFREEARALHLRVYILRCSYILYYRRALVYFFGPRGQKPGKYFQLYIFILWSLGPFLAPGSRS
jgi:hypothetical protein